MATEQQMSAEHRVSLRASIAPQPGHLDVSPIMFLTRGTVTALLDDADALAAALAEVGRLRESLVQIDTYLAHDPQVWRIVSVAKAGDVLCDVLGAETIARINGQVARTAKLAPADGKTP